MNMNVVVNGNVEDQLKTLADRFPIARNSALNKMVAQLKTQASREVRDKLIASKSDVDKTFSVTTARGSEGFAVLRSMGKRIPVPSTGAKQTDKGVIVKMFTSGATEFYTHAFIATMKSGHVGVFLRRAKAQHSKASNRWGTTELPIFQVTAPSVPTVLGSPTITDRLIAFVADKLPDLLNHEIQFFGR